MLLQDLMLMHMHVLQIVLKTVKVSYFCVLESHLVPLVLETVSSPHWLFQNDDQ